MTSNALPPLAARVLDVLADGTGYTDQHLADMLGTTPDDLSPVIGLLYHRKLADRCRGYIVASASVPRRNGTSGTSGTCAGQSANAGFRTPNQVPEPPEPSPPARAQEEEPMPADASRTAMLKAALWCAARSWWIFPLRPADKRPAFPDHKAERCTGRDPWCRDGHQGWEPRATTDTDRIRRAWAQADWNVGIATGPSGLVVIDLDMPKPGEEPPPRWAAPGIHHGTDVLATLCEEHGQPFPCETFMVRTRRGGLHLYFTAPPGAVLHNTSGRNSGLGWLVDTRAHGGYVVGPGSIVDLPDGTGRYEVVYDRPPAPLPAWLATLLTARRAGPPAMGGRSSFPGEVRELDSYVRAALQGEVERVCTAEEGGRTHALNKAAYKLGRLIAAGALPEDLAERELFAAASVHFGADRPVTPAEARASIRGGIAAGKRQPRRLGAAA
jgi:hypothetical protein